VTRSPRVRQSCRFRRCKPWIAKYGWSRFAGVWGYIQPVHAFRAAYGFSRNFEKRLAERDPKAVELFPRRWKE